MKKGASTSLNDFPYYGTHRVGDIVMDLDSGIECEIDRYGRAMDKYGIDRSKKRLGIVKPWKPGDDEKKKRDAEEKAVKEAEKDFQMDQFEDPEELVVELAEETSPAGGQTTNSETSEAMQSSTVEENAMTEEETAAPTLVSFTDQQLADELRTRGYEVSASKIIMVPQEVTL
ncbi:MAG: hypothetical protein KBS78_07465 [Bacteroidales bacterium]|nr:hypothetical protein [Candidatus Cryptobacteroides faecihippi]